jgi:hypothetical protein
MVGELVTGVCLSDHSLTAVYCQLRNQDLLPQRNRARLDKLGFTGITGRPAAFRPREKIESR